MAINDRSARDGVRPTKRKIMTESETIQKVSYHAFKHFPCLLCGDSPVCGAAFVLDPVHAEKYGAESGKGRAIGYSLCKKCTQLPRDATLLKIEQILLSEMKRRTAGLN